MRRSHLSVIPTYTEQRTEGAVGWNREDSRGQRVQWGGTGWTAEDRGGMRTAENEKKSPLCHSHLHRAKDRGCSGVEQRGQQRTEGAVGWNREDSRGQRV